MRQEHNFAQAMRAPAASQRRGSHCMERTQVPDGSASAKGVDYSLNHWADLERSMLDGDVPTDNNPAENRFRPWATVQPSNAARMAPMLRPCATTATTAVQTTSTIFAMAAMLGRLVAQLRMNRLDTN